MLTQCNENIIEIVDSIKQCIPIMKQNYGISFDENNYKNLINYGQYFYNTLSKANIHTKNYNKIDKSVKFLDDVYNDLNKIYLNNKIFKIYNLLENKPWTLSLEGSNILIISKYNDLIKKKCKLTNKLYDIDLFPKCNFTFIEYINTCDESKSDNYEKICLNYKNILIQLDSLYDIVLLDVGGLIYPMTDMLSYLSKSYIDIGDDIKYYFGIYDDEFIKDDNNKKYINELWNKV
jgi:hypothetical protein